MPVAVACYTLSCACGNGLEAIGQSLGQRKSGLRPNDYPAADLPTWTGSVRGPQSHQLPASLKAYDSRNNRLIDHALGQDGFDSAVASVIEQLGSTRVAVIMGSSTASMAQSETVYLAGANCSSISSDGGVLSDGGVIDTSDNCLHTPHAPGQFVAARLGIDGPALTISTACSSSAKVFAQAARWIESGVVDAVVVGGADSLSLVTLYGFKSLELLSTDPCRPFDKHRNGISVGEAAGFALLTNEGLSVAGQTSHAALTGYGESCDAHHMSQPHPEASGTISAMRQALQRSHCSSADIGYINLHGTATPANDLSETRALADLFDDTTPASSTKGWTGHTLGAAGITGTVIALEALRTGLIPGTLNLQTPDDQMMFPILQQNINATPRHVMVNAFGFGGNNCSLVFSKTGD